MGERATAGKKRGFKIEIVIYEEGTNVYAHAFRVNGSYGFAPSGTLWTASATISNEEEFEKLKAQIRRKWNKSTYGRPICNFEYLNFWALKKPAFLRG